MASICDEIREKINDGSIADAPKEQLEKYATTLCRQGANNSFGSSYYAVCGTIRTLIIVRMSEEANKEATRISKIALAVAVFALICGAVQVILGVVSLTKETTIQVQYPTAKDSIKLQPTTQPTQTKK